MLPPLVVKILEAVDQMTIGFNSEWKEWMTLFQKEWDDLPGIIKPPPGAMKANFKFKNSWSECTHLLHDKDRKKLGYMNVASSYYARTDNDTEIVSHAYDDDTTRNYSSKINFKSRCAGTTDKEHVQQNAQAFNKTMSGRSQSGRLIYERMIHVQAIVSWEEYHMMNEIKDGDGNIIKTWHDDLRDRSQWPEGLLSAIMALSKSKNDRLMHRRLIQIYEEWPFLLRMNDDSGGYTPLCVEPHARYSYVSMKRAEGVTKTYFAGNEWSVLYFFSGCSREDKYVDFIIYMCASSANNMFLFCC